jgi:uncharacterized LabA/DUF88 family protein
MSLAVLIDGGFFLKRFKHLYPAADASNPAEVADILYRMVLAHADGTEIYRIFYYDCPPLGKKAHNPIDGRSIDFSKTDIFKFRMAFFDELKRKRKVALRLGTLQEKNNWLIRPAATKELLNGSKTRDNLTPDDVYFDIRQKGVDIKIGLDIASLAYKKQVTRIVLISGDSDFVPAAKLARREGIDFILDPLWNPITPHLFEHIDGLMSKSPRPKYLHHP